jgi:hypothetical protein
MYLVTNGQVFVIRFFSKSLVGSQLNWSAREKECYGIYYGVKLFEDLLDNRFFILKTDHTHLTFILVIIDAFSRWVELFPTKSTTAAETASMLLNHVGRFGSLEVIHNELITEVIRLCGIEQSFATAYSSEENGFVERANQEVLRHRRALLFDSRVHDK